MEEIDKEIDENANNDHAVDFIVGLDWAKKLIKKWFADVVKNNEKG